MRHDRIKVLGQRLTDEAGEILRCLRDEDFDRYSATLALARRNGWTLTALAQPLGITREGVRRRIIKWNACERAAHVPGVDLPLPPRWQNPMPKSKRQSLRIPDDVAQRLRNMHAVARTVRGTTPLDDPRRQISLDFTETLWRLNQQGVSYRTLADVLGCTIAAIRFRFGTHGYRHLPPSQKPYRHIMADHCFQRTGQEFCKRGHSLSGDNIWTYQRGKYAMRVCKACSQLRYQLARAS